MIEPLLLFESIMVEDRSIMLLVDSNYSYRSDEMQSWYNDDIFGKRQNRNRLIPIARPSQRTLPSRREGVITSAATLTMTSEPLRTSPQEGVGLQQLFLTNLHRLHQMLYLKLNKMMSKSKRRV